MKTDNTITNRIMTSDDLLNTTQKNNYRATITPLKRRGELMYPAPLVAPVVLNDTNIM